MMLIDLLFFFSSRRRHTRSKRDWSSDVCSSDLAGKEEYERYHKLLGLDQPVYVQYWKFASRAVLGDFGKSWYTDTPAFSLVLERMPPTLYLTSAGLVAALLSALPLGILAALKRHSLVDNLCTMLAVAGQAMPIFWLGIMLIIIFAVRLKVLPASGYG